MFARVQLHFSALLLVFSSAASAQPTRGLPPFGSFGGAPDTINNANLNVHLEMPTISKAGRGLPFTYTLTYDSAIWAPVSVSGTQTWTPASNWGWGAVTQPETGYVSYQTTQSSCTTNGITFYYWQVYSGFVYHDQSGTPHPVTVMASTWSSSYPCGGGPPNPMSATATDGSGYSLTVSTAGGYLYVTAYRVDGAVISPPLQQGTGTASIKDTNGNYISVSENAGTTTFTDTLGTTALTVSSGGTLTYTNPSGGNSSYQRNYSVRLVRTNFGCPGISEYLNSAYLLDSIVLPDGTQYSITYEPTPGFPGSTTGRIASVTLPTGGSILYAYSGGSNGINCSDGSGATLSRTTPDGIWTYQRTGNTTTVTNPAGNDSVMVFQGIYEVQRRGYQGSSTSGTLMKTVDTCYNGSASPCTGTAVSLPITQVSSITSLPFGGSTLQSKTVRFHNSAGMVTEVDEYGYGTGAPGSVLRKTITTYASLGNGILNRPATITVRNGSDLAVAQTNYTYDEGSVTATSGTPQHSSVSGSRGNATRISRWVSASTWLDQTFTYYDTGNVRTATDANGAVMTYTYGACGNSFVTNTALPLSLTLEAAWNCAGGVQTSTTDANSRTATIVYNDPNFWRPTATIDQTSETTNIAYATSPVAVESTLNFNGATSTASTRVTLDDLGRSRVKQTRQSQGSSTYDSVRTDYDAVGRPWRVTVPYQGTAGQIDSGAAAVTTTTYDALNRRLQVTDGGGGTITYGYNQNDILVTIGPAATGENAKRRQLEYDALGRLTSVCEITSAPGSGSCGQTVAQTGFLTVYTYDPLDNLLTANQNVQSSPTQTRTFTYDGLGRLKSEQNPETSGAAYIYYYDSDGTCGTSNGDLVKRTDPVGNVTCYA